MKCYSENEILITVTANIFKIWVEEEKNQFIIIPFFLSYPAMKFSWFCFSFKIKVSVIKL